MTSKIGTKVVLTDALARLKYAKNAFVAGAPPDPAGEAYSSSLEALAGLGATLRRDLPGYFTNPSGRFGATLQPSPATNDLSEFCKLKCNQYF